MIRRRRKPEPASWRDGLRDSVAEDVRGLLDAGWLDEDVVFIVVDAAKERLIEDVSAGLIAGGVKRARR